jgi:uncharacterized membrane protein (UPF0127 family)
MWLKMSTKKLICILMVVIFLTFPSCNWMRSKKPTTTIPTVCFQIEGPKDLCVEVEVADTHRARSKGLMYRETLDDKAGMLFIFPREEVQHFWMKNTYIPLDMIFIGKDLKVVGVVENAVPMTETLLTVGKPSKYVLEVNGGWSASQGIKNGYKVQINLP